MSQNNGGTPPDSSNNSNNNNSNDNNNDNNNNFPGGASFNYPSPPSQQQQQNTQSAQSDLRGQQSHNINNMITHLFDEEPTPNELNRFYQETSASAASNTDYPPTHLLYLFENVRNMLPPLVPAPRANTPVDGPVAQTESELALYNHRVRLIRELIQAVQECVNSRPHASPPPASPPHASPPPDSPPPDSSSSDSSSSSGNSSGASYYTDDSDPPDDQGVPVLYATDSPSDDDDTTWTFDILIPDSDWVYSDHTDDEVDLSSTKGEADDDSVRSEPDMFDYPWDRPIYEIAEDMAASVPRLPSRPAVRLPWPRSHSLHNFNATPVPQPRKRRQTI
ncbi:hypothetical protein F4813DRAFT_391793 [Daldinia decipiens]|uniref:uncharacterized protein n=1 Tax=Daldinia decipiens TaxID=326647 RepID=UPI0020C2808F|nr:uncharacterized protein F4813DRAFT_391793 [Daldinia decipiens]KAI1655372.1 hypothetical protein F4813DRAFT_391793 [Daldinia decipiens]